MLFNSGRSVWKVQEASPSIHIYVWSNVVRLYLSLHPEAERWSAFSSVHRHVQHLPGDMPHCSLLQSLRHHLRAAKKIKITGLNDHRPVALTSVVMKSFERLVLSHLKTITDPAPGPPAVLLQSRHVRRRRNQHGPPLHPPAPGPFADLRSAFNTIIPSLLQDNLYAPAVSGLQTSCLIGSSMQIWGNMSQSLGPSAPDLFSSRDCSRPLSPWKQTAGGAVHQDQDGTPQKQILPVCSWVHR